MLVSLVSYPTKTTQRSALTETIIYPTDASVTGGNLSQRYDAVSSEAESFSYDFLDRLTAVSGAYSHSYAYNQLGNITSMNGSSYTYGSKPHAVTSVGGTSYTYDSNGNMTGRGNHTLTWNIENQPASYYDGSTTTTFVYDGDGRRGKKTAGGTATLYVNKYYEKTGDTVPSTAG